MKNKITPEHFNSYLNQAIYQKNQTFQLQYESEMSHCIEREGSEGSPALTKDAVNKQFDPLLGECRHVRCAIIGSAYG